MKSTTDTTNKIKLNKAQQETYNLAMKGESLYIGGGAGVGKTTLVKEIIKSLKSKYNKGGVDERVLVSAPTGLASSHINGITLHKAFSLNGNFDRTIKFIKGRLQPIKVLIIDEVSMASRYSIDRIDFTLKFIKGRDKPFGGIQVIFIGDFLQLPPIVKDAPDKLVYPFLSKAWDKSIKVCYLTEKIRQKEGDNLVEILDSLRDGTVSDKTIELLESRLGEQDDTMSSLLPTNREVDYVNKRRLSMLTTPLKSFNKEVLNLTEHEEVEVEKNTLVSPRLDIKEGALVLFIKNDKDGRWVNGSMGTVKKITKSKNLLVDINGLETYVSKENFYIDNRTPKQIKDNPVDKGYMQYPIKLGWAITIHKSQGMTLDGKVFIDLSNTFAYNQAYVSLSRLTKLENLTLGGFNHNSFMMDAYIRDHIEPRLKENSVVKDL